MDLPYHLLIVDDDALTTDTLAKWFEFQVDENNNKRWIVTKAYNGKEAIELIKSKSFDALVLDLKLPEFNGEEVLKHCHLELLTTCVVVLTAYKDMLNLEDSMKLGIFGYFQKPLNDNNQIELCLIRGIQNKGLEKALFESFALCKLSREISHDAKNYLTPLLGFAELLEYSLDDKDKQNEELEYVRHIIKSAQAVKVLSSELLQFSNNLLDTDLLKSRGRSVSIREINKIPSPGMEKSIDKINVNQLLNTLVTEFSRLYSNRVEFQSELYNKECILIRGNEFQLDRVFRNLLTNAIEAMNECETKKMKVSSYRENGSLKISFSDSGPGISKENIKQIFHPFFTTKKQGTGMGLYVSERLINLYGGKISISSEQGKGTDVTVEMPVF